MSDAAMKVDPEFCTRSGSMGRVGGGGGGGGGSAAGLMGSGEGRGGMHSGLSNSGGFSAPSPPDYIVRQHSFLGFYLSLNPGDEADAERRWGFPQPQRAAIAGVTVVVPLFLALFLTGSWLWKACVIGVVTVAARQGASFALRTVPDLEIPVQGYSLSVWPHLTLGALTLVGLIWFATAAASGTGWSTIWLCLSSLLFLMFAEAALRAGMHHFQWWVPAERFTFLKPWGDYSPVGAQDQHQNARASSYAPPRPMAAQPPAPVGGGYGGYGSSNGGNSGLGGYTDDRGIGSGGSLGAAMEGVNTGEVEAMDAAEGGFAGGSNGNGNGNADGNGNGDGGAVVGGGQMVEDDDDLSFLEENGKVYGGKDDLMSS